MTVRMDGEIMVLGVVIPSVEGDTADGVGVSEKERMKVGSVLAGPGGREGKREKGESRKSSEQQTSLPTHHVTIVVVGSRAQNGGHFLTMNKCSFPTHISYSGYIVITC